MKSTATSPLEDFLGCSLVDGDWLVIGRCLVRTYGRYASLED